MFRADLEAARNAWIDEAKSAAEKNRRTTSGFLRYVDGAGRVADFHALRHTFISNLARGGVHPKLAQDLARHSDVNLTLSRYSHTQLAEQTSALAFLPSLDTLSCSDEGSGIGASCSGKPDEPVLHQCLRTFEQLQPTSVDSGGLNAGEPKRAQLLAALEDVLRFAGLTEQPPVGFEPTTCGLQNREHRTVGTQSQQLTSRCADACTSACPSSAESEHADGSVTSETALAMLLEVQAMNRRQTAR